MCTVVIQRGPTPNFMTSDSSYERLLTVSVPEPLHAELHSYAKRHGFPNLSSVIRYALENSDTKKPVEAVAASRQVSFRIADNLRESLDKQARKSGVSLGHLIRTSLERLPEKPAISKKQPAKAAAKPAAKKAPAKKAAKPAKKGRK